MGDVSEGNAENNQHPHQARIDFVRAVNEWAANANGRRLKDLKAVQDLIRDPLIGEKERLERVKDMDFFEKFIMQGKIRGISGKGEGLDIGPSGGPSM